MRRFATLVAFLLCLPALAGLPAHAVAPDINIPTPATAKWATVLCSFQDTEPQHDTSYYTDQLSNEYPGMEHYWEDVSYGRIDLDMSDVFGWFELPHSDSYYVEQTPEPWYINRGAYEDCRAALDEMAHLPDYIGITMWFDGGLTNAGWGFQEYVEADGVKKLYGVTLMTEPNTWDDNRDPPNGIHAHEMGHAFGLQHTGGGERTEYGSQWDVMSSISSECFYSNHPDFECIQVHPIAFQKMRLGWIRADEIVDVVPGETKTFTLTPLSEALPGDVMMGRVKLQPDKPGFLTLEARTPTGYDESIPGDAVVMHRWKPYATQETGDHPYVIDGDQVGNGNDEGAQWIAGETYTTYNGIEVSIVERNREGYVVKVVSPEQAPSPTNPDAHDRVLKLEVEGHLAVSGKLTVTDGYEECAARKWVTIQKQNRFGDWMNRATAETNRSGEFRTHMLDRPGRYRAMVRFDTADGGWEECRRTRSVAVRHNHG